MARKKEKTDKQKQQEYANCLVAISKLDLLQLSQLTAECSRIVGETLADVYMKRRAAELTGQEVEPSKDADRRPHREN